MAASVYVPSTTRERLAPVVPLHGGARRATSGLARPAGSASGRVGPQVEVEAPGLRLVVTDRRVFVRRRIAVLAATLALAMGGAVLGLGVASASAPVAEVSGHVVLQPGETLWDVAVRSAPPGVDARRQLADIRRINGFGGTALEAWTVVLLPG
jgi:hypothetical protein